MATYHVSSGQVVSNQLVYGDVETVYSGGKTQDQTNAGQRFVLSGGLVANGSVRAFSFQSGSYPAAVKKFA
ncbi:hypothetical protein, partial [Acetobacter cibinongensis]|uniref:hypothetical protein n=1 Tax=Acetobacter cibinongensis TaxID=146475 RepID=UPI00196B9DD5